MKRGEHPTPRRPVIEALEARILYSADFAPQVLHVLDAPVEQRQVDAAGDFVQASEGSEAAARGQELAFVATDVPGHVELADLIARQAGAQNREIEIVPLQPEADGVRQISDVLALRNDISAVHLLTHGTDGKVALGNTTLDLDSLQRDADTIRGWGQALTAGADLLVYGCDVAATDSGRSLMEALAQITGADVAASVDRTGSPALDADWDLEYLLGEVDTPSVVEQQAAMTWYGVLAPGDLPPAVAFPGAGLNYSAGSAPRLLNPGTTVTDPDSLDFDSGTFTAQVISGGNADDRLTVRNFGSGPGQIGLSGSNVTYGGVMIGSAAGGIGAGSPLVVSFNANATPAAAQALARNITYSSVSAAPVGASRTVQFVVADGDGGVSNPATMLVTIQGAVAAPPVATGPASDTGTDFAIGVLAEQATKPQAPVLTAATAPQIEAASLTFPPAGKAFTTQSMPPHSSGRVVSEDSPVETVAANQWTPRLSRAAVDLASTPLRHAVTAAPALSLSASLFEHVPAALRASTQGIHAAPSLATPLSEPSSGSTEKLVGDIAYSMGLTMAAGAIWWANRTAGMLVGAMLSTAVWHGIDPLPAIDPDGMNDADMPAEPDRSTAD